MVNTGIGELPPGAELSDSDDYDHVDVNDPHRALNIDLDLPLRDDERLPVSEHRVNENNLVQETTESKGKKKEKVICFFFCLKSYNILNIHFIFNKEVISSKLNIVLLYFVY